MSLESSQSRPPASFTLTPPPARNRSPCCFSSPTGHLAVTGSFLKCQSDHTSPLLKSLQRLPIKADKIPNSHQNFQSPHILSLTNLQMSPLLLSHFLHPSLVPTIPRICSHHRAFAPAVSSARSLFLCIFPCLAPPPYLGLRPNNAPPQASSDPPLESKGASALAPFFMALTTL